MSHLFWLSDSQWAAIELHLSFRRRERAMLRFRQMSCLQKFASIHASVHNHINQNRSLETRSRYKGLRNQALA